jgi:hypothetical protein
MPLPTGSVGVSWITGSLDGDPVSLNLPATYSYVYQAPRTPTMSAALSGIANYSIYYRILYVTSHSVSASILGNIDRLEIHQTNGVPFGLVDTQFVEFQAAEVQLRLSDVILKYSTVRAPSTRRGLYLQRSSGSPHISIEPIIPSSSWLLPGDVWMLETESVARGLYYADYHPNTVSTSESINKHVIIASTIPDTFYGGTW